jgi:outer membrane protein
VSYGQNCWSLDSCLHYALEKNLTLKELDLDIGLQEVKTSQTKNNFLPDLNAIATGGYNGGQYITPTYPSYPTYPTNPTINQFPVNGAYSENFNINMTWTLFSGLHNYYLSQKAQSEFQYQVFNKDVQERNIKIDITAHYLQILLNDYQLGITQEQFNYTKQQKLRIQELLNVGRATQYQLLQLDAQLGLDSLAVTKALNELRYSKVLLQSLLNLKKDESFDVLIQEDLSIKQEFKIADSSVQSFPEIKQIEELEKINSINLKIAQAERYPTLSLKASLGTGYSGYNEELIGTQFHQISLDSQFNKNYYQSIALTLTIPIFSKKIVSSEIATAKIEVKKSQVQREQAVIEIQNKIDELNIEVENAKSELGASETSLKSITQSFEEATSRYEEGLIDFTSYLQIKKTLFEAQSEYLQSKFQYLFKMKTLDFYTE